MLSKTMMARMPCAIFAPRVSFQAARRTAERGETAGEDGPRAACSALLPFAVDVSSLSLSISVACSPSPGHASRAFAFLGCVVDKRRVLMRSEPEKMRGFVRATSAVFPVDFVYLFPVFLLTPKNETEFTINRPSPPPAAPSSPSAPRPSTPALTPRSKR